MQKIFVYTIGDLQPPVFCEMLGNSIMMRQMDDETGVFK